jgi:hypothetical protein
MNRLLFLLVYFVLSLSYGSIGWAKSEAIQGPILVVGHGLIFDSDGKRIEPTIKFILEAQNTYKMKLLDRMPPEKRTDYLGRINQLVTKKTTKNDVVNINAQVISTLIDEVAPDNASNLLTINAMLEYSYGEIKTKSSKQPNKKIRFKPSPQLIKNSQNLVLNRQQHLAPL